MAELFSAVCQNFTQTLSLSKTDVCANVQKIFPGVDALLMLFSANLWKCLITQVTRSKTEHISSWHRHLAIYQKIILVVSALISSGALCCQRFEKLTGVIASCWEHTPHLCKGDKARGSWHGCLPTQSALWGCAVWHIRVLPLPTCIVLSVWVGTMAACKQRPHAALCPWRSPLTDSTLAVSSLHGYSDQRALAMASGEQLVSHWLKEQNIIHICLVFKFSVAYISLCRLIAKCKAPCTVGNEHDKMRSSVNW